MNQHNITSLDFSSVTAPISGGESRTHASESEFLPLPLFIEESSEESSLSLKELIVEWDPDMLEYEELTHQEEAELESQDTLICDFSSQEEPRSQHGNEEGEQKERSPRRSSAQKISILVKAVLEK
jgi:hypothetical protein